LGPGNEARLELCGTIEAAMAKDDPQKIGTNKDTEPPVALAMEDKEFRTCNTPVIAEFTPIIIN